MSFRERQREPLAALATSMGGLFGFIGWATVGLGLVPTGLWLATALVGGTAAFLQERSFLPSLAVEVLALAWALSIVPATHSEWVWAGGALAMFFRALAFVVRRQLALDA